MTCREDMLIKQYVYEKGEISEKNNDGGHACKLIGTTYAMFMEDLPLMLPTKFLFIWPNGFREDF